MVTFWTSIDSLNATPVIVTRWPAVAEVNQTDGRNAPFCKGKRPRCDERPGDL
jgi:hypothetical protein